MDSDLANLYGLPTKTLNQAVKRNKARFPADFLFRLTKREKSEVVTICDHLQKLKFLPLKPFVFTKSGVAMPFSKLRNGRATQLSRSLDQTFAIMRT